jgi:hypothetical protein
MVFRGRKPALGALALAVTAFPTEFAYAQNCASMRAQWSEIGAHGRALVADNPGITMIVDACKATADGNYKQSGDIMEASATFSACGSALCGFATGGYANCISVGTQILFDVLRVEALSDSIRRYC